MKAKRRDFARDKRVKWLDLLLNNRFFVFLYEKSKAIDKGISGILFPLVSKRKIQYVFSLVCALILSVSCYVVENQPYALADKSLLFYFLEMPFRPSASERDFNVQFVNVGHDRQLVYVNPLDTAMGNTDITDRRKLLRFLQGIAQEDNYKYVLLDIRFDKGYVTEVDSLLFDQIRRMRNIVVAHHEGNAWDGYELASEQLRGKTGISDYKQFANITGMSRYTFLHETGPSLALAMYDDLTNHHRTSVKKCPGLPVYVSKKHLCVNAPLLPIKGDVSDIMSADFDENGMIYNYYTNMGADWLNGNVIHERRADLDDAYIVIGDFENDVHDTYAGRKSGAYISWLAFAFLYDGNHILSWSYVILVFLFYALMFFFMFFLNNIFRKSEYRNDGKALAVLSVLRWLATIGLLYLVTFAFYKFFSVRYNVTIPLFSIVIVNILIQKANKYEENLGNLCDTSVCQ
ncbi:MAG: hypothetical protein J5644_10390 [Bacteroidales bacterium]|nr:hypothetical protein [Bacteroidales bacterium]